MGFEPLINDHFRLAVDLLSEYRIGENQVMLPPPVQLTAPFRHDVVPTNIPGTEEHVVSESVGVQYTSRRGLTSVSHTLIPTKVGALQPRITFTAGVEYSF